MVNEWTAPPVERTDPAQINGERAALEDWLEYHRSTLLMKCAGLTAAQLKRRPLPPSGLSLLGLVRHMTEVERWWFRVHGNGEELDALYDPSNSGADFDVAPDADAEANIAAYVAEVAAARAAMEGKDLDLVVPDGPRSEKNRDIRWIYVHMIEEYARHNGHADLLREAIDGTTGD